LCLNSEDTEIFFLPLALLLARTFLPFAEAMRSLNPCLFFLFLLDGWNVLLLIINVFNKVLSYKIKFYLRISSVLKLRANIRRLFSLARCVVKKNEFFLISLFSQKKTHTCLIKI